MSQANIESLLVTSSEKVVGSFDRTITSDAPKRTDTVLDVPTVANRMQLVHECLLRWVETPMDKGGYNKRGVSAPAYPLQTPFIPYHRETLAKALEMTGGPIDRS